MLAFYLVLEFSETRTNEAQAGLIHYVAEMTLNILSYLYHLSPEISGFLHHTQFV